MQIIVKYFGTFQEAAGTKESRMDVAPGTSAEAAYRELLKTFPAKARLPKILFAVNQEFVKGGQVLRPGDELALIPPIAGG